MILENIKIRTKVVLVIVLMALVALAGLAYVNLQLKNVDSRYSAFIANETTAATLNARASLNLVQMGLQLTNVTLLFTHGSKDYKDAIERYTSSKSLILGRLDQVAEKVPSMASAVNELEAGVTEIIKLDEQIIAYTDQNRKADALPVLKKRNELAQAITPRFSAITDELMTTVDDGSNALAEETGHTILVSLVALGAAVLLVSGLGLYVSSRGITGPIERLRHRMLSLADGQTAEEIFGLQRKDEIGQMAAAVGVFRDNALDRIRLEQDAEASRSLSEKERLEREAQKAREAADTQLAVDALAAGLTHLANGDVTYRIETPFVAHLDGLRGNFNDSVDKLQRALEAVGENARSIDAGANEIRSAADDLSRRTEQQAASVEETAAALEQITTTVTDSTSRAEEAGHLVDHARAQAERSGEVMRRAVTAMHAIEKSSEEISNIIGVIDEIAFQTNLLALNAGVEAARAGDAGKGFAVVAQEVRELAQRSAQAAKEIKALISASGEQVRTGVELVAETGGSLEDIVGQVREINAHVRAIVEAAREQSTGLQEINTAVNTMDQGTQQNAAMVEQSTAASHALAREAAALNDLLAQFTLSKARGRAAPRAAAIESRPVASPARALGRKIANAFSARGNAAVAQDASWEEF
ncbi:methyl-accepting chemotaxis protein [Rhizobium sp. TRM96647]|uniref:methyl-accepting chemotaxis protein n=1 Tax=unclassified Rhizobium TaxID=2613769 RepID=UPI0021E89F8A|nr:MULTISPECIES: HAMP domain-containing methyl-accepting chemotaxis protein [unclassified Rhizobium]MCV3737303.1 methyl-accepting chemotaxis protein [Rhizobium sp. TRM96647]MCV3759287.1 methyl-accepting chemotaxis protein [Rhizobium sp. TRM96650]